MTDLQQTDSQRIKKLFDDLNFFEGFLQGISFFSHDSKMGDALECLSNQFLDIHENVKLYTMIKF